MKNVHEDRLGMFTKVAQFLADNQRNLTNYLPALAQTKQRLDIAIAQIMDKTAEAQIASAGYTAIKAAARLRLENNFLRLGRTLSAYAVVNARPDLTANSNFSRSTVEKMRDNDLYIHSKMLYDLAMPIMGQLIDFLYTATEQYEYETSQTNFYSVIQLPKMQIGNRALRNTEVVKLMSDTSTLLSDELDVLMSLIEYADANLYALYHAHRQIDHSGGRTPYDVIETTAAPNATAAIAAIEYDADVELEVKNMGADAVSIGISTNNINLEGTPVEIAANETKTLLMSALGTQGDFLIVKNATARAVPLKVTLKG